jgi:GT2 family glycosyltransferase
MNFAIITPIFNRRDKTLRFLKSLERQTFKKFKLFLVDSGSTDGTLDALDEINLSFDFRLISVPSTYFWSGATNAGVREALREGASYVVTLNDDSLFDELFLERMNALLVKYDLDILTTRIDYFGDNEKVWLLGADFDWGTSKIFYSRYNSYYGFNLPTHLTTYDIFRVQAGCGNGVFIGRDVFENIGLYDEVHCPHYHGDSEFLLRASLKGYEIYSTTKVRILNDRSDSVDFWKNKKINDVLFSVKSPFYWRAVKRVVFEYCPGHLVTKTLFLYYRNIFANYLISSLGWAFIAKSRTSFSRLRYVLRRALLLGIKAIRRLFDRIEERLISNN